MVTNFEQDIFSDLPIPPGELLEEEIAAIGMTQQELAMRTGRPAQVINEIIRGKKAITHETAIELEMVLGIPAHVWVNLEATYHLTQARLKERDDLLGQQEWLKEFPVRELEKRGWVESHKNKEDKIRGLLEFLGVASFQAWRQTILGFRISEKSKVSPGALAAWLRQGELKGRDAETADYNESNFHHAIKQIRTLTLEEPEEFLPQMTQLCAEAGVAVILVQELSRSGANGVARWLTPTKGIIQLSLKWKWHDIFWFSFFHECCHILNHHIREVHIDGINGNSEVEFEANTFAQNLLIPTDDWTRFTTDPRHSETAVRNFASEVGIHPGIVVGRMQREKLISYSTLSNLKTQLAWKES